MEQTLLKRNIDIALGLVNGAIGKVISIIPSCDNNDLDKVKIVLATALNRTGERQVSNNGYRQVLRSKFFSQLIFFQFFSSSKPKLFLLLIIYSDPIK